MTSAEHFDLYPDGSIAPKEWLQQRLVATAEALSVSRNYVPSGGGNKDDLLQSLQLSWTNGTPITQTVMGLVTRGGSAVSLQARSRGYMTTLQGYEITATPLPKPESYDLIEVSRSGIGIDVGKGGLLAAGSGFAIAEKRQESRTAPFMPHSPGMIRVEPGQTLHARCDIRFRSEFWENTSISGGSSSTGSMVISGDTRFDMWAFPAIIDPGPRLTPTIVGVTWDSAISDDLSVAKPGGTTTGDTVLAFMFNQWGPTAEFLPIQAGWLAMDTRTGGLNGLHFLALRRVAGVSEPANYTFANATLAEATVILVTVRNASEYPEEWYAATVMRTTWWDRNKGGHIAPSINRNGQLLMTFSAVSHAPSQAPITHEPPAGMTELLEISNGHTALALATLLAPPRPTGERAFTLSEKPVWSGHSITMSLLIPGARP